MSLPRLAGTVDLVRGGDAEAGEMDRTPQTAKVGQGLAKPPHISDWSSSELAPEGLGN